MGKAYLGVWPIGRFELLCNGVTLIAEYVESCPDPKFSGEACGSPGTAGAWKLQSIA
jgi:hypothetical protein